MNFSALKPFILLLSCCLSFVGCEGEFAGNREVNLSVLNGPTQIRLTSVGGTSYLAVLNTNSRFQKATGSLQFYSVTTPSNPVLNADLNLSVPINTSDFWVESGTDLYLANRNENKISIYELSGGVFTPKLDSAGVARTLTVAGDPQRLLVFTRASDSVKILAVLCQTSGTIMFFRLDTYAMITAETLTDEGNDTASVWNYGTLSGAYLDMVARTEQSSPDADRIVFGLKHRRGFGVNDLVYLGGARQTIVTGSFAVNALFGFHFASFDNSINYVWDLAGYINGRTSGATSYPGSGEHGLRGIVADGSGNVYFSSRADNSLYKISNADFDRARDGTKNTRGYPSNDRTNRLAVDFDSDETDSIFPKLGDVTVNNAGTLAYVLGYGVSNAAASNFYYPRVFRVDTVGLSKTESAQSVVGENPQKILLDEANNLLYISNTRADTISIVNATTLALVATIVNP